MEYKKVYKVVSTYNKTYFRAVLHNQDGTTKTFYASTPERANQRRQEHIDGTRT